LIRKNRRYSREFKLEAVRLTEEEGRTVAEVSRELGIPRNNLYNWRSQLREEVDEAFPGKGNLRASEKELHRLRRENERLREERDILKKAITFFSRESR
jgi:transposase